MALASAISSMISSGVEGFEANQKKKYPGYSVPKSWINFVVFVVILLAVAFFGKLLWNELIAGANKGNGFFTIVKPLPTVWHALAMYITLDIFFGSS